MGRRARARQPEPEPKRGRWERERPGTIRHGPPISVTCECGAKRDLRYGEAWTCETCGRRWNTTQIPPEQYEVIRRMQMRFRAVPVALGLLVAAVAIFFSLTGNAFSVFFLLPVSLMIWFTLLRPVHRKRYRAAIGDLPRWNLRPE